MSKHYKYYQQPFYCIKTSISKCLRCGFVIVMPGGVIGLYISS